MKRFSRVPFPASGIVIALILLVFSWTGVAAGAPLITSLFPAKGPVGSLVTLEGSGFTDYQGLSSVDFGKKPGNVVSWNHGRIVVAVPGGAVTSLITVTVCGAKGGLKTSNGVTFRVTSGPLLKSILPSSGKAGVETVLNGLGFGSLQGKSTVHFDGTNVPAEVVSWSDTEIRVRVPGDAATGNVFIKVNSRPSNGIRFVRKGSVIRLCDNWTKGKVSRNPHEPTTFTLSTRQFIARIVNYHWSPAELLEPGKIRIKRSDGVVFGPWQAIGKPGRDGTANAHWECYPRVTLQPGTYTVLDSEPSTWAWNEASGNSGFSLVEGRQTPAVLFSKLLSPSTSPQTVSYGKKISLTIPGGGLSAPSLVKIITAPSLPQPAMAASRVLTAYEVKVQAQETAPSDAGTTPEDPPHKGPSMDSVEPISEYTLQLEYDPALIPPGTPPRKFISIGQWNPKEQAWKQLPTEVDPLAHLASAPVKGSGVFAMLMYLKGCSIYELGPFRFIYDAKELNDLPKQGWYTKPKNSSYPSIPDFAEDVMAFMMHAYKSYKDAGFTLTGPVIVYIGDLYAGPMLINNYPFRFKYTGHIFIGTAAANPDDLRQQTAHELFHAIQAESYGYLDSLYSLTWRLWWVESTADYAAQEVAWKGAFKKMGNRITKKYLEASITDTSTAHDKGYDTAHFIKSLVQGGADFKKMWDYVANPSWWDIGTVISPLDEYLRTVHGIDHGLPYAYQHFANDFIFNPSSAMPAIQSSLSTEVASVRKTLNTTEDEVTLTLNMAATYTAKLGAVQVWVPEGKTSRNLQVEVDGKLPSKVQVDVYALPDDRRDQARALGRLSQGMTSVAVTGLENEKLYFLAVNVGSGQAGVTIKVRDTDPIIKSITPRAGRPGSEITLVGSRFGESPGYVVFWREGCAGYSGQVTAWSAQEIRVIVPKNYEGDPGNCKVRMTTDQSKDSNTVEFAVYPYGNVTGVELECWGNHHFDTQINSSHFEGQSPSIYIGKKYFADTLLPVGAPTWSGNYFQVKYSGQNEKVGPDRKPHNITLEISGTVSENWSKIESASAKISWEEIPPTGYYITYINKGSTQFNVSDLPLSVDFTGYFFKFIVSGTEAGNHISDVTESFHQEYTLEDGNHFLYKSDYVYTDWASSNLIPYVQVVFELLP